MAATAAEHGNPQVVSHYQLQAEGRRRNTSEMVGSASWKLAGNWPFRARATSTAVVGEQRCAEHGVIETGLG